MTYSESERYMMEQGFCLGRKRMVRIIAGAGRVWGWPVAWTDKAGQNHHDHLPNALDRAKVDEWIGVVAKLGYSPEKPAPIRG